MPTKQVDNEQEAKENLGGQLAQLLDRLERIQGSLLVSTSGTRDQNRNSEQQQQQPPAGVAGFGSEERQLLASIRLRLEQTERLLLSASGSGTGGGLNVANLMGASETDSNGQSVPEARGANQMRYSTPNLLLSTNLEHILRQRDRVSKDYYLLSIPYSLFFESHISPENESSTTSPRVRFYFYLCLELELRLSALESRARY